MKGIRSLLNRIENAIAGNPSTSQTSEGEAQDQVRSKRKNRRGRRKEEETAQDGYRSDEPDQAMFTTDGALTCPDLTKAVLESTQRFH